jgi:hypothetical protein
VKSLVHRARSTIVASFAVPGGDDA